MEVLVGLVVKEGAFGLVADCGAVLIGNDVTSGCLDDMAANGDPDRAFLEWLPLDRVEGVETADGVIFDNGNSR